MTDLFRREAVDHQRLKFAGALVLAHSPGRTAVAALVLALVGALAVFAATQGFARRAAAEGVLLPAGGVLRLVAPQAGTVQAVEVAVGATVQAGEAVVRLATDTTSAAGPTQAAIAATLARRAGGLRGEIASQALQARAQAQALDDRLAALAASRTGQAHELALQRDRVALARDVAARYPALVRSGAVSPVEASEKQAALIAEEARLSELERAGVALDAERASLRAERAQLPLAAGRERSQLEREADVVAQAQAETAARRGTVVAAPAAGALATVLAQPGQAVAAGQVLATLLPDGRLEAELLVPTAAAGFVVPGTAVRLRVDAFPYARFGALAAHVREVAGNALPLAALAQDGGDADDATRQGAVFRVRAVLDADPVAAADWRRALRPGMRVQASLVAERRTLLQWALEPLAALRAAGR